MLARGAISENDRRRRHGRGNGEGGGVSVERSTGRAPLLARPAPRNRGVVGLFIVVAGFVAVYAWLFRASSPSAASQVRPELAPLILVSMAQAMLLLTGGINLAIGPSVSLSVVIAATTMSGVSASPAASSSSPSPASASARSPASSSSACLRRSS